MTTTPVAWRGVSSPGWPVPAFTSVRCVAALRKRACRDAQLFNIDERPITRGRMGGVTRATLTMTVALT